MNTEVQTKQTQKRYEQDPNADASHLLQLVTDILPALICYIDNTERYRFVNGEYERWFGRPPSDFIGKTVDQVLGSQIVAQKRPYLDMAFAGQKVSFEAITPYKDGTIRHTAVTYVPDIDVDGSVRGFLGFIHDISDLKRIEADLRSKTEILKKITDNTESALFMLDRDGRPTFMNPAAETITGFCIEEISSKTLHEVLLKSRPSGESYPIGESPLNCSFRTKFRLVGEDLFMRKDGTFFPVSFSIAPILNGTELTGTVVEFQDITKQKRLEQDLMKERDRAESASRAKTQFLVNMSHEIRTPLSAILGFADLLSSHDFNADDRQSYFNRIRTNGDHLIHLIDDILDLSKFEAGKVIVDRVKFPIVDLVSDVIKTLMPMAFKSGLAISCRAATPIPQMIHSDPDRLKQILTNLIGNAIKFTEHGEIKVVLKFNSSSGPDERSKLTIEVMDSGIGISEIEQQRLFLPFSQADASITRKYGGTGLGLALSRRLAQALGGDLRLVRSSPGEGSCFELSVDPGNVSDAVFISALNKSNELQKSRDRALPQLPEVAVLVADDAPDGRELLRVLLQKEGANVTLAKDGLEVLTAISKGNFDVILMDIQMPVMDGLEATRQLRQTGYKKPILAVTAHALRDEVERSLVAGCNAHLTKPINKSVLVRSIQQVLHPL